MKPTLTQWILDFFWPTRCVFCGEIISPQKVCCSDCLKELSPYPSPFSLPYLDTAFSCTKYSYLVSHAIARFKFRNQPQLAKLFAQLIVERFSQELSDCHIDCICGVAMHPKRQRQRGYNQANLLAKELSDLTGIPFLPLLEKTKSTPAQHTLSASQRKQNLAGAYRVIHPESVSGKRILLVDDVITTGSTMGECACVLRESGAVWVGGLSFAHTVSPSA